MKKAEKRQTLKEHRLELQNHYFTNLHHERIHKQVLGLHLDWLRSEIQVEKHELRLQILQDRLRNLDILFEYVKPCYSRRVSMVLHIDEDGYLREPLESYTHELNTLDLGGGEIDIDELINWLNEQKNDEFVRAKKVYIKSDTYINIITEIEQTDYEITSTYETSGIKAKIW